jgi:hypothetical protein
MARAEGTVYASHRTPKGFSMKDLLFVVVTAAFFALAWIYAKSFDRL